MSGASSGLSAVTFGWSIVAAVLLVLGTNLPWIRIGDGGEDDIKVYLRDLDALGDTGPRTSTFGLSAAASVFGSIGAVFVGISWSTPSSEQSFGAAKLLTTLAALLSAATVAIWSITIQQDLSDAGDIPFLWYYNAGFFTECAGCVASAFLVCFLVKRSTNTGAPAVSILNSSRQPNAFAPAPTPAPTPAPAPIYAKAAAPVATPADDIPVASYA